MTIGGFRVSEAQFEVLDRIWMSGEVTTKTVHARTGASLMGMGLIEMSVPTANTYAMAARGRMRYYRLTAAGKEAITGLKKLYDHWKR